MKYRTRTIYTPELTAETGTTPEAFRKFMERNGSMLSVNEKLDEEEDDGPDNDYDYGPHYTPPKRGQNPLIIPAEDCSKPISNLRKQMLNPDLDRYDIDGIAQILAHYVATSGGLHRRIDELTAGKPYEYDIANAMRSEYEALIEVQQDKQLTAQRFGEASSAMAVSSMLGNKIHGQPIDLLELKNQMEGQMKALSDSGANRQDKLAMLALKAQQAGEALMIQSASAPTGEAKALILKSAVSSLSAAAKMVEQLHNLSTPVGTIEAGDVLYGIQAVHAPNGRGKNQGLGHESDTFEVCVTEGVWVIVTGNKEPDCLGSSFDINNLGLDSLGGCRITLKHCPN